MPELPEVEMYTRYFASHAFRQRIARVDVRDERILGMTRKEKLTRALKGKMFRRVRRHGKNLFADAGDQWVHFHFGMSGDLAFYGAGDEEPRFARLVFDFVNGKHLAFEDMRLFGIVELTPDPDTYIASHRLGPDPLEPGFTLKSFRSLIEGRRGAVKALLMSQDVIAGIGNLYADEMLFQTSIHPRRSVDRISPVEVKAVYTTMRRVLREMIDRKARGAGYPVRYLVAQREEGERCPLCGGTIKRIVVFGRTTYFCGKHQK